ncbi:unnamed protein product [Pieris macdunnoughi]|uniref:THAP-type domain-containing protein n=1 Tax=Pieris macdunnoughi TaxID=345717 RepID=A0A821U2H2_9NEOP|nr:unnamed protein product [Pieris macdunnoughi]
MSAAKENRKEDSRRCSKCGKSTAKENVSLFRFPNPGVRNLLRCTLWAKYLFPSDEQHTSIAFQKKLYAEHRMLCQNHFHEGDFTDGTKKSLLRTAVPHEIGPVFIPAVTLPDNLQPGPSHIPQEPQAGPSKRIPLREIGNFQSTTDVLESEKIDKESKTYKKCLKYMHSVCQLRNRIKNMKLKLQLNALTESNSLRKLSEKISPTFALLLQGQLRNYNKKITGRRWTKEEKIVALRLFKRSPTCYRLLRRLFYLPSPGTLKALLNRVPFAIGITEPVLEVLKQFLKTQQRSDNNYILMFDEISLKKHFDYNPKEDVIDGYQDHGAQGRSPNVASHALVFMVAGIRKTVKQPIAHFFSSGFSTADRLAVLLKEILQQCFASGINISATVCDMDGVNRRALSILGATVERPYITVHNKEIVTLFDTPHLVKCFRNLFLKYDIECTTNISSEVKKGKGVAKWSHIKDFFEIDNKNPNFVFAPALTKDHLNPNAKQKMRVKLAAQVLSHTVAAGLYAKIADGALSTEAAVTANVISHIDKLFDALNSDSADLRRGKIFSTNMTAKSPHHKLFQNMKYFFKTMKFMGSLRTPPSQEGWIWTINGVERLFKQFANEGIKSLATRRLQQDPLENLFGCIRGNCGSNSNPTVGQFVAGLKTSILSRLAHIGTTGCNCETDNNVVMNNYETLLSVSQPRNCADILASECSAFALSSSVEPQNIEEDNAEMQACAYVCGFLIKKICSVNNCEPCKHIFVSTNVEKVHKFVDYKEYNELKKSLHYANKSIISCVEKCATLINSFFKEKSHKRNLKTIAKEMVLQNVNFDYIKKCEQHGTQNIHHIIESVFFICVKRFCILKNRLFADEASASALKRKMKIIMHK